MVGEHHLTHNVIDYVRTCLLVREMVGEYHLTHKVIDYVRTCLLVREMVGEYHLTHNVIDYVRTCLLVREMVGEHHLTHNPHHLNCMVGFMFGFGVRAVRSLTTSAHMAVYVRTTHDAQTLINDSHSCKFFFGSLRVSGFRDQKGWFHV
jgi:hypothetical protein